MRPELNQSLRVRPRTAMGMGLILYAGVGGAVSLAGWAADLPRLADWLATGVSIQPNTAVATMIGAAAVLLLSRGQRRPAAVLGAALAAIGVSHLFQYASGVNLERLNTPLTFGREWGRFGVSMPGRMGPAGAMCWTLLGPAVMFGALAVGRRRRAIPRLALGALAIAMLSMVGYLYRSDPLYTRTYSTAIALQTATFIAALSAALIVATPDQPPMRWLLHRGAAGTLARRMLPFVLVAPPLMGWLALQGGLRGLYDGRFAVAILVLALIGLLSVLLSWNFVAVARHEAALKRSERRRVGALERRESEYQAIARLHALSIKLVRAGELRSLLGEILAAAADLTGTRKGHIQLYDPQTGRLGIEVHQGLGPRFVSHFAEGGWERGCGAAAEQRQRVIIDDLGRIAESERDAGYAVLVDEGIQAFQSTPLLSRDGRLLGMLNNHFTQPHRLDEHELRHLDLLARMAADFIERSQQEQVLRDDDRRKDEFLAMLSHELRNPLAPIRNALEVLRRAGDDRGSVQAASEMMDRQLRQLIRLVDELLDVSRVTRGKIELRRQPVELRDAVSQAVESTRWLVEEMRHKLEVALPDRAIHVQADRARLIQVFGNLLHNACKFTEPGGRIQLTLTRDGEHARVVVRDSGIGIAADQLPRIFELFAQVDTSLDRSVGGLGIGLTLVKTLVDLHGGSVEARSDGPGRGAEFSVRLATVPAAEARPEPARAGARPATQRRRVLIVDDNRDSADSLAMLLALGGNETRTAHDGPEAIEAAGAFLPHLMLLDIGLPQLTGYEVCRRIREQAWGQQIRMVAVTGWGQDDDRARSRQAGFDAHFVKPVDPEALAKLLDSLT